MTRVDLHPEELLDRALNGALSKDERTRLEAHLASCKACRLEHSLVADSRRSAAPRAGDAVMLERVRSGVARAFERGRYRATSRRRTRSRSLALAAVLLFFGGFGAAAVLLHSSRTEVRAQDGLASAAARAPARSAPIGSVVPAERGAPEVSSPPESSEAREGTEPSHVEEAPVPTVQRRQVVAPSTANEGSKRPSASAAELFANANSLRRAGQTAEAVQSYRDLARSFPGSSEALTSRVTLGRLLLDRVGDAGAALVEFDGYLARAPRGALSEEAVIGRALSLGRLGRSAEERHAWTTLLTEHPGSTYAARARSRIERLSGK